MTFEFLVDKITGICEYQEAKAKILRIVKWGINFEEQIVKILLKHQMDAIVA
jgi:hypothetical protein